MIRAAVCNSFKRELLAMGPHQAGDVYKIALYKADATLSKETTVYSPAQEVQESHVYSRGGQVLEGFTVALEGDTAYLDWMNAEWPNATMTARGALIYNSSRGDRAVAVLDFGKDVSSTNGMFVVDLPDPGAESAVIRIS